MFSDILSHNGKMSVHFFIGNAIGLFVFLFVFWKRLKEDYISSQVFSTSFSIVLGIILFNILARIFFPTWWFWASFVGVLAGFVVGLLRFKLRVLETIQALLIALLPWLGLNYLVHAIGNSNLISFLASMTVWLLIGFYLLVEAHYKKFTWYQSGKVGFSGLATAGLFFLTRAAVAVFINDVISFSGKSEPYLSAIVAFVFFLALFNLVRRRT